MFSFQYCLFPSVYKPSLSPLIFKLKIYKILHSGGGGEGRIKDTLTCKKTLFLHIIKAIKLKLLNIMENERKISLREVNWSFQSVTSDLSKH